MKAIEQYFHVVLFIMLYKVVLTLKSVDETMIVFHHSIESSTGKYFLSCGISSSIYAELHDCRSFFTQR